jgi:hypothetical protein
MIKFFRKIRYKLLNEKKLNKYLLYAIGEILLVVVGILIAVSIGEWRQNIKQDKELTAYYQGLSDDLSQDKLRLESLISLFDNATDGIVNEIDKMQHNSYNEDSLYSNVSSWMVYVIEFTPNNPTFKEILSSGKLQLFNNRELKFRILNVYSNLYPELQIREHATSEFIRNNRTDNLMDTFRWLKILDNDKKSITDLKLNNPIFHINHDWLDDKQSDKYLKFENYLNVTRAGYLDNLKRYKNIKIELESLILLIDNELGKRINE